MKQTYYTILMAFLMFTPRILISQEIKIFNTSDFDLNGDVKSCLVSTKYGKEEYEFNKKGLLTKAITRYSDTDYDISYYQYKGKELIEKRFENYRDNILETATSIANLYEIDTVLRRKVTEKILSYEKEFLDQYEYYYDLDDRMVKIIHTNNGGIDETLITYTDVKGESTKTYTLSDEIQKSIRSSTRKIKSDSLHTIVLTKKFLEGNPNTAVEEVFDSRGLKLTETKFGSSLTSKQFEPEQSIQYYYTADGMLEKTETKGGEEIVVRDYIYQYDERGNWIKEIISPQNTYKTRKIDYYVEEEPEAKIPE